MGLVGTDRPSLGCNKDSQYVWSRTSCAKGRFSAVVGNPLFTILKPKQCLDPDEGSAHVRVGVELLTYRDNS